MRVVGGSVNKRWRWALVLLVLLTASLMLVGCGGRGGRDGGGDGAGGTPAGHDSADPGTDPKDADDGGAASLFPAPGPGEVRHPLTGLPVAEEDLARPYSMVVVGNNPTARPQSGLPAADLVYEIPAEGGITRFLALYRSGTTDLIGPVRSSRTYILDLAREWRAVLAHVGGSPGHYEQVGKSGVRVMDDRGASGSGVFWRTKDRRAPDNLYTSTARLRQKIEQRDWRPATGPEQSFRFALPAELPAGTVANEVVVPWPGQTRTPVTFHYDPTTFRYERRLGSGAHTDREEGEPLTASSLLVQFLPVKPIPGDTEGRLDLTLVGRGDLLIVTGGTVRSGSWSKSRRDAPTVFADGAGDPVTLLPGQVWILLVPEATEVATR